jgi:ribulose-5-phosphate 4-epimerase/fuculose-1-phosphate aldolase
MLDDRCAQKLEDAVWVAGALFSRGKITGSAGNISFIHKKKLYISRSGACFGRLVPGDFALLDLNGSHLSGSLPSKEWPLHQTLYRTCPDTGAVLHVHSTYATLFSCTDIPSGTDPIPYHTPYLSMLVGSVGLVEFHPPGSPALFEAFTKAADGKCAFLLKNHGPIVAAPDIMAAFCRLEELEESARIAWHLIRH